MLQNLQKKAYGVETKKNSKGNKTSWTGYKLRLDSADDGIPISSVLSSASTCASQVAIALTKISDPRFINLYDLMDSAYDVPQIHQISRQLGMFRLSANTLVR